MSATRASGFVSHPILDLIEIIVWRSLKNNLMARCIKLAKQSHGDASDSLDNNLMAVHHTAWETISWRCVQLEKQSHGAGHTA